MEKLDAIRRLETALDAKRKADKEYEAAHPLGRVSKEALREVAIYPRPHKGLPPGVLSPLPYEKLPSAKIEGAARVGVDLKIDRADGFVLRETRKETSVSGDVLLKAKHCQLAVSSAANCWLGRWLESVNLVKTSV